jgi:hypothetical protein
MLQNDNRSFRTAICGVFLHCSSLGTRDSNDHIDIPILGLIEVPFIGIAMISDYLIDSLLRISLLSDVYHRLAEKIHLLLFLFYYCCYTVAFLLSLLLKNLLININERTKRESSRFSFSEDGQSGSTLIGNNSGQVSEA